MAAVRLADVIIPEIYLDYDSVNSVEKTAFFESGVAVRSPLLDEAIVDGGRIVHVPFWNDLDPNAEPNYSTDDPAVDATPQKITAGEQIARIAHLNQGYSATDLAGELAGSEPMRRIRDRFGVYWMRQWQRRALASLVGVMADNVANDSGDMVEDISIADGDAATAANLFSRTAFTDAAFTLGDMFESVTALAVHSVVYKRMVDNDDIEFIPDSQGRLTIPTFLGRRVVVDDGMPVEAGATSGFVYTSILMGPGLLGYGSRPPKVPVEVDRDPAAANGGGVETLWERNSWILHPTGFAFTSTTLTGGAATARSANLADLRLPANWNRVVGRKNVPLAFLRTNG